MIVSIRAEISQIGVGKLSAEDEKVNLSAMASYIGVSVSLIQLLLFATPINTLAFFDVHPGSRRKVLVHHEGNDELWLPDPQPVSSTAKARRG